ncbi:MAG: Rne/Rng family ribonuclease [Cyanobacteria bacterium P01_H01_bin.15]
MPKQIIIAEQHQVAAVYAEEQIQELVVSTGSQQVSDIYLGIVENIIPGIDAAFVNIGKGDRNGFIHVTDLGPARSRRSAGTINELLAPQQQVLVQVMKEPTGNKGPRLTGNITLPGRYLVLMPYSRGANNVNLSRRIRDENERSRLRALAILLKPAGMGLLVRTEAEGKSEKAIIDDLDSLQKQWEQIQNQANTTRAPALLNRDDDFIQRVLRDMYSSEVNRIVVDSAEGLRRVKGQLSSWSGGRVPEGVVIDRHQEMQPILDYFRINGAIREALKPRVDLPSGGYIIIEPTEALTVIDVNSGSFTRSATARETVLWTNTEAATEIARQLRLRNIGGVIIVDFIDMDSRRDQLKLLEVFTKALKADKARPQIAQLSELGLVELTRKRQGKNLYELFGKPCPVCAGLSLLVRLPGHESDESLDVNAPPPPPMMGRTAPLAPEVVPVSVPVAREASADSFELLHHPSYQEQSSAGGNGGPKRRRRRRGDGPSEEDSNSKPNVTPTPVVRKRDEAQPPVQADPQPEEPAPNFERRQRRIETPAEQVYVEMSPLEQEIYALAGISPLVRLARTFKDPKSVIVSVTLPGEAPPPEPKGPEITAIQSRAPESAPAKIGSLGSDSVEPTLPQKQMEIELPILPDLSPNLPESSTPAVDEEEDGSNGAPVVRRRRRRSSARR